MGYENSPVIFCDKNLLIQLNIILVVFVKLNNYSIAVLQSEWR